MAALRERLDAADERVERLEHVDRVLRLAETELAEAAAETYRDFAPLLNASLEAGISRLTGGRYAHAFVDEELSIRVEAPETGAVVDLDRLSVGTQKQAYLVQRLELVRLLCPGARPCRCCSTTRSPTSTPTGSSGRSRGWPRRRPSARSSCLRPSAASPTSRQRGRPVAL